MGERESLFTSRFRRARYVWWGVQNDEAQFFWKVGHWEISAGFFKGFGFGVTVRPKEWDVVVGCFSVEAVRV